MKYWKLCVCLLFAFFPVLSELSAQSYQLQLEKVSTGKIKQFDLDDKLFYRLKGEKKSQEGLLTGVDRDRFYVDGEELALEDILFIGKVMEGRTLLCIIAIPIVIIGIVWMALGGLFLAVGNLSLHAAFTIGGFMDLNAGAILTLGGALPLIFKGKQYRVTTGFWELQTVPSTE